MRRPPGELSKLQPICESLKKVNVKTESILSQLDLGENYLVFDSNKGLDEFKECLSALGQISYKGFLPTRVRLKNLNANAAGLTSSFTIEICNHHGDSMAIPSDSFSVQIIDPTGTELCTQLCTTGPDCIATFTTKISGLHQVSGIFLGQELTSEPTHISVSSNNPVSVFGGNGNGHGTFENPWGIAIDKDSLYVTDSGNRLIQKFSASGEFLSQFNVNGHDKDCTTLDVALDLNNGLIYCTDIVFVDDDYSAGNNMLVFNLDGELQHKHPLTKASSRISIAMNNHGDIFISDITKKCLCKVNKVGNKLSFIGKFKYPGYIAIDTNDNVIVSDCKDDCIYIFNPDGTINHKFGSSGAGHGQLKEPWGVATDGKNILVADSGNNRIQVFKRDGTCVSVIESKDDPLEEPRGLVVTDDGHVYVVDRNNNCVKKYKYRHVT